MPAATSSRSSVAPRPVRPGANRVIAGPNAGASDVGIWPWNHDHAVRAVQARSPSIVNMPLSARSGPCPGVVRALALRAKAASTSASDSHRAPGVPKRAGRGAMASTAAGPNRSANWAR